MGRIRSINNLAKVYPTIQDIYMKTTEIEPKLLNKIRFKKLRGSGEYLFLFSDEYSEIVQNTLFQMGIQFVDELLNSFLVSNIPMDATGEMLYPQLSPIIGGEFFVDFFDFKQDAEADLQEYTYL